MGQIHKALEYQSWTAYIKDTVQIHVNDRAERKSLVTLMSGKGMPTRAIAAVLGKSQSTTYRDLEGVEFDTDTVIAVDGTVVARKKSKVIEEDSWSGAEEEEVEVVEEAAPTPAADLVVEFDTEAANLHNAVAALAEIMTEPKWPGARKRVTKANLNNLQEVKTELEAIIDDLMTV